MDYIFTIDGVGYNVGVVSIHRTANIKDGPNADTALSGKRWRDVQGTFYDYTMEVSADGMSREDYDAMYEVLSAPVDSHVLVAPYGQTTISFTACIEVVEDDVLYMDDGTAWGNLTVNLYAQEAKRKPT
jgi:hypothetical protein|nr:MAG TPA: hypothetical protein [Caudoviricetes sp.]